MVIIVRNTMRAKDKWGCLIGGLIVVGAFPLAMCGLLPLLFLIWIVWTAAVAPFGVRARSWHILLEVLASVLLLAGGLSFFGSIFLLSCDPHWIPARLEWPVGYADGVITTTDGLHLAPLTEIQRVQLYDSHWRFIRGWQVDARGRTFALRSLAGDRVEVITSKDTTHSVYSLDGKLLLDTRVERDSTSDIEPSTPRIWVPTHWWLMPFTHPLYSFLTLVAGVVVMHLTNVLTQRRMRRQYAKAA